MGCGSTSSIGMEACSEDEGREDEVSNAEAGKSDMDPLSLTLYFLRFDDGALICGLVDDEPAGVVMNMMLCT
jgi:hypothetical protein